MTRLISAAVAIAVYLVGAVPLTYGVAAMDLGGIVGAIVGTVGGVALGLGALHIHAMLGRGGVPVRTPRHLSPPDSAYTALMDVSDELQFRIDSDKIMPRLAVGDDGVTSLARRSGLREARAVVLRHAAEKAVPA